MKTRGTMFAERKEYINKLTDILSVFPNFGEIKYARTSKTEGEYLRISDIFGKSCFLDITSMPLHEIYKDISKIVVYNKAPGSLITNTNTLNTIARYFW